MMIINNVKLELANLIKVDEYIALYEEANKLRVDKYSLIPVSYKNKLENIREIESIRLFEIEKNKLDKILKMADSVYDYPNLLGTTKCLIEEDNGYSIHENYEKFKKELYSAIESDVMGVYEDIERNIDGSYDESKKWMKNNEI
ncbi:MAG: hypothetical protein ACEQSQ_10620 [Candidatus Paceibacteria bacterium]